MHYQLIEYTTKKRAGYELEQIQHGLPPTQWKSINDWGSGVVEIKLDTFAGAFRVVYIAKFEDAIYILHCFAKKTQQTSLTDITIIKTRYAEIVWERQRRENERKDLYRFTPYHLGGRQRFC